MVSVCLKKSLVCKIAGIGSDLVVFLTLATNAFAQTATGSAASKGGTSSSLPTAGTTEITYAIFAFGVILFVFGTMKLVKSFR